MTRSTTYAATAVCALLACLVLAGCSSGAEQAAEPSPSASPTSTESSVAEIPEAPRVGTCHALTVEEASAPVDEKPAVPCRGRHTTVTFAVGTLPQVQDGHLLSVDSATVRARLARVCAPGLAKFVGGDRTTQRLSRLQAVTFSPSLEQSDAGADWYRCDALALQSEGRLAPLPRRVRGVLDQDTALDTLGTCGTAAPGSKGFARVACSQRSSWRAVDDVDLDTDRFLDKATERAADASCRSIAEERAAGALRFTWSFEWPTRAQWNAGQRWGLCWLPKA